MCSSYVKAESGKARICLLVVDDDIKLRKLLAVTFNTGEFEVHEASNGEDAVRLAAELQPEVVLLDVMLAGPFNGLEVCRKIKSQRELGHTAVILLTALGQQHDRQQGLQAGADEYIVKPFSPLQLVELVHSVLARRLPN